MRPQDGRPGAERLNSAAAGGGPLGRSGELTAVRVPDAADEAVRVSGACERARTGCANAETRATASTAVRALSALAASQWR